LGARKTSASNGGVLVSETLQDFGEDSESIRMNQNMSLEKMTACKWGDNRGNSLGIALIRIEKVCITLNMAGLGRAISRAFQNPSKYQLEQIHRNIRQDACRSYS
jgi:hypothetical protein